MLLPRISGSLVAAVVGDCIGAVFEGRRTVTLEAVMKQVDKIEQACKTTKKLRSSNGEAKVKQYEFTDDTAMARSIADSLVEKKTLDVRDIARKFSSEYKREPDRGYGSNVVDVLEQLGNPDLEDIFSPARQQFNGSGSYGNGGAMRIAPLGLFFHEADFNKLKDATTEVTALTHSHPHAILGAVLQSRAVQLALNADNTSPLDTNHFLDTLLNDLRPLEKEASSKLAGEQKDSEGAESDPQDQTPYCDKLEIIRDFLTRDVEVREVEEKLGNNISALGSVPAAVYCFLKGSQRSCPGVQEWRNEVEQTIIYAISLGGDTDTIATMAAAIAGAFYGIDKVPESWQEASEGVDDAKQFAEKMVEILAHS